jgi:large subunit ribosomal protein L15
MIKLSELKPHKKSVKRRKVVGRGLGSGHGTFSGRGAKGQKARSGASIPAGFEGGRMPLHRQTPKRRGFTSRRIKPTGINLSKLSEKFTVNQTVNPRELFNRNMIKKPSGTVKILGEGEINKALTFEKVMVTAPAKAKIEKAGGKVINAA